MSQITAHSIRTPIYRDAGFHFDSIEQARRAFEAEKERKRNPDDYIYTRYRNPTVVATETTIANLEGNDQDTWALLTASGMSAIDVAVSIFQEHGEKKTGKWLFFDEIYVRK